MKSYRVLFWVALVAAVPLALPAQVALTPMFGGYLPANNVQQVTTDARSVAETRQGTLSLGLNLDLGALRGTLAYASGTTIQNANRQDIGKGNVLGAAADLVVRPLPRILVQPYLIAGAGEKFFKYDQSATLADGTPQHVFALHGGLGADVMLGPVGVAAELTDFLSRDAANKWDNHDAFLMMGLKLKL
jgi:hypothetical protein